MSYDLFIAYASADNKNNGITEFVELLSRDSREFCSRPLEIYFDANPIEDRDAWINQALIALSATKLLVVCLTPAFISDELCERVYKEFAKLEHARKSQRSGVVPVVLVPSSLMDQSPSTRMRVAAWIRDLQKQQSFSLGGWLEKGDTAVNSDEVKRAFQALVLSIADRTGLREEPETGDRASIEASIPDTGDASEFNSPDTHEIPSSVQPTPRELDTLRENAEEFKQVTTGVFFESEATTEDYGTAPSEWPTADYAKEAKANAKSAAAAQLPIEENPELRRTELLAPEYVSTEKTSASQKVVVPTPPGSNRHCSSCGNPIPDSSLSFCGKCGSPLRQQVNEVTPQPQASFDIDAPDSIEQSATSTVDFYKTDPEATVVLGSPPQFYKSDPEATVVLTGRAPDLTPLMNAAAKKSSPLRTIGIAAIIISVVLFLPLAFFAIVFFRTTSNAVGGQATVIGAVVAVLLLGVLGLVFIVGLILLLLSRRR